jgi:hypothetical protein
MKTNIVIEIANIRVFGGRYYSFDWKAKVNGVAHKGSYDSDYSNQSANTIRRKLKTGYATQIALQELFQL